uniref:protein N-terminal methyltransferase n=1 Tax=Laticauda laticaudata TaxID=8630 RepID=A0A8C5T0K4_LATLA
MRSAGARRRGEVPAGGASAGGGAVPSGQGSAEERTCFPQLPRPLSGRGKLNQQQKPAWLFWRKTKTTTMASDVVEDELEFYSKAEKYWRDVPPTVDGMLGGYGHISSIDISSSRKFLHRFLRDGPNRTGTALALDCGAGIGRITKRLLLPLFKSVDMVDVTEDFLNKAKTYLGTEGQRVRNYFCCGLQDFSPEPNTYDVIWIQWVIGHLTDEHLLHFLQRCRLGLRPNGIIIIKDNMAQEGVIMDEVDSSVCRDLEVVCKIIRHAGLSLLAQEKQENFPDEIYHVYTLAMR